MKILCGIVTYYPSEQCLKDCVKSIIGQVDGVVIVDNTPGKSEYIKFLSNFKKLKVIYNENNQGIAMALSQIMDYADNNGFSHVLTLDQDSISKEGLIENYEKYWRELPSDVGALTSAYEDKNTGINELKMQVCTVKYCITAGFFVSVEAYRNTSGYDKWMFIDRVDWDICYSLNECGYKIYSIPVVGFIHEIGKGKDIYPFGKHLIVSNHIPWRRFFMARNGIYMARKHPMYASTICALKKELLICAVVFFYEGNKIKKLYYGLKGVIDGMLCPLINE